MTSTQTGEVLLSVSTTKTIISTGSSMTFFRFFDMGTTSVEIEAGHTINEPVNYAVRVAIEQAVVELIKEGEEKKLWKFKTPLVPKDGPKIRPLPLKKALDKWPDARLNCSADNLCRPR